MCSFAYIEKKIILASNQLIFIGKVIRKYTCLFKLTQVAYSKREMSCDIFQIKLHLERKSHLGS